MEIQFEVRIQVTDCWKKAHTKYFTNTLEEEERENPFKKYQMQRFNILSRPNPGRRQKISLNFLFSHVFLVPQKVL